MFPDVQNPRRAGSLHGLPESVALLESIGSLGVHSFNFGSKNNISKNNVSKLNLQFVFPLDERHTFSEEYEFKGIIIEMTLIMDVHCAVSAAAKAALDPFFQV